MFRQIVGTCEAKEAETRKQIAWVESVADIILSNVYNSHVKQMVIACTGSAQHTCQPGVFCVLQLSV